MKSTDKAGKSSKMLHTKMTLAEFENSYWYADELKQFAKKLGIPQFSKLRKDQIEKIIITFLKTGKITQSAAITKNQTSSEKDSDKKLSRKMRIIHYKGDKKTKAFIESELKKIDPCLKKKSGDGYWLNRWREEQLEKGKAITYGDLIDKLISLRKTNDRLPQIPSTKYNNFVTDYLNHNKKATKSEAVRAWYQLKDIDAPKTYESYKHFFKKVKK